MKKQIKKIDVNEYLNDLENVEQVKNIDEIKENQKTYNVLYLNNYDFGLQTKTAKTDKRLHFLFSQQCIIFEDFKKQQIKIYNDNNNYKDVINKIFNFTKNNNIILPELFNDIIVSKDSYLLKHIIWLYLNASKPAKKLLLEHKINMEYAIKNRYYLSSDYAENLLNYNEKVYNLFFMDNQKTILFSSLSKYLNKDDLLYFANECNKNEDIFITFNYVIPDNSNKYVFNGKRFTQYFCHDLINQGIKYPLSYLYSYIDYLNMQIEVYGKVVEKYPKYFLTEHQKLASILRNTQDYDKYEENFSKKMKEIEDISYNPTSEKYCILMPQKAVDLVNEGIHLNHCVATYVTKVINDDCVVVFMREKNNKIQSLLTIEVLQNNEIVQIEGKNMRRELTDEEQLFIIKWARKKGLKIKAENVEILSTSIK